MTQEENNETKKNLEKKVKAEIQNKDSFNDVPVKAKNLFKNKDIIFPVPMCISALNKCEKIIFLRMAMRDSTLHEELINEIMSDLITGAYQNRREAYSVSLNENCKNLADEMRTIQKLRQSADMHLLAIIKVMSEIKQPVTKVTVKEAQQVNVADKQVNINQKSDSQNVQKP